MTPTPEASPPLPDPVAGLTPIATARLKHGLTLSDLARAAQIDPAHLELMERGSHYASPTLAELERIAAILHLGVDEIR